MTKAKIDKKQYFKDLIELLNYELDNCEDENCHVRKIVDAALRKQGVRIDD